MAKIFRFSGYLVEKLAVETLEQFFARMVKNLQGVNEDWLQRLYVEESEEFEIDGETEKNCDLELLTRHFKKNCDMEFDRPLPQKGEVYRHFKTGKSVDVVGISRHTETEEVDVVYEHDGKLWSRPLEMFMSEVDKGKYPEAGQRYRFQKVEEHHIQQC